MKAYYARPITHYGTKEDEKTINLLKEIGLEVEDPNQEKYQEGYKERGMSVFLDAISKCDILIFKPFWEGFITAGVAKEIKHAKLIHIPVIELTQSLVGRKVLSVEETRKAIKMGVK